MEFNDRDIVVTGGASGIGKAIAGQFAAMGNRIHIIDIDIEGIERAIAEISRNCPGRTLSGYPCDITDFGAVEKTFAEIEAGGAQVGVLINSAGIAYPGYVEHLPVSVFQRVMQVNFMGTVHTVKALLPYLLERGEGYIVNISSLCSLISVFGYTAYGASKFAVRGFTEVLRRELSFKNICVSLLCPPDTDTPQLHAENKLKPPETFVLAESVRPMTADAVACHLVKAMKKKKFLIIPGLEGKLVSTIARLFPGLADRVMESKIRRYYARRERAAHSQMPVCSGEASDRKS